MTNLFSNNQYDPALLERYENQAKAWQQLRLKGQDAQYTIEDGPAAILRAYGLVDAEGTPTAPVQKVLEAMRSDNFGAFKVSPQLDDDIKTAMVRIRNLCQTHVGRYIDYAPTLTERAQEQRQSLA